MPSTKAAIKSYNIDLQNKALLSPITVTASSSIADELLSPKSVTIYSREDIARSGVSNLLDFFKYNTENIPSSMLYIDCNVLFSFNAYSFTSRLSSL